eukprot:403339244
MSNQENLNNNSSTSQQLNRSLSNPRQQNAFSPTNTAGGLGAIGGVQPGQASNSMSNFFNTRGPIRPQNLLAMAHGNNDNSSNSGNNNQGGRPGSANSQKVQLPQARDFIRQDQDAARMMMQSNQLDPAQQKMLMEMMRNNPNQAGFDQFNDYGDDDGYGSEGDDDEDGQNQRAVNYTPEEQQEILRSLLKAGAQNPEFMKVLDILQRDEELRPLIFEHETLLIALKDMFNLKAESMLSILTAAETEMYESSKVRDELQATNSDLNKRLRDLAASQQQQQLPSNPIPSNSKPDTQNQEISVNLIQEPKPSQDTKQLDKLQKQNDLSLQEIERLRIEMIKLEQQKQDLTWELTQEKQQRETQEKDQEEVKISILDNKSKLEVDLKKNQQFIDLLHKEIQMLEKENDNAHRKLNSTLNSILFQSHINQNFLQNLKNADQTQNSNILVDNTPARRNLSTSFQNSGLIDQKTDQSLIGQPVFGFGQSTQRLKMLMSENNKSQGNQSFIAHSIYYGLGGGIGGNHQSSQHQNNIYFQRGDSLVRSNSIEVILFDDDENKKHNMYALGEEEKSDHVQANFSIQNKQSWLKTKALLTDLSPINSISSQQNDKSTQRQRQQFRNLQDAEEEKSEILGTIPQTATYTHPVKYYEEQIRKMQLEIEKQKDEIKELTQKLNHTNTQQNHFIQNRTDDSPYQDTEERKIFATPQNNNILSSQYQQQFQNAFGDTGANGEINYHPNIQMTSNINPMYSNEQSPMMATFSNQKDRQFYSQYNPDINQHFSSQNSSMPKTSEAERQKIIEEYRYKIQNDFANKLKEIGTKLISLFKRFNPAQNELNHYYQDINVSLIKEIIMDITNRLDYMFEMGMLHHQSRIPNTPSQGLMSQGVGGQPFQYFPQSMANVNFGQAGPGSFSGQGHPTWMGMPNSAGMALGSQIGSTTMDQTPFELKNLFLEEKERRLKVVEELHKTQENFMKYKFENEKLKQDLIAEKQNNQTMVYSGMHQDALNHDKLVMDYNLAQRRLDMLQDENLSLKLKVANAESELLEERYKKQHSMEYGLDLYKDQLKSKVEEQKQKYEVENLNLKQEVSKLNFKIESLIERNKVMREEMQMRMDRITELEHENFQYSKEQYVLQNELDYEVIKSSQISNKKTSIKQQQNIGNSIEIQKLMTINANLEVRVSELQHKLAQVEVELRKSEDLSKLRRLTLEEEARRIQIENQRLQDDLRLQQDINKRSSASFGFENNMLQSKLLQVNEKSNAISKLRYILAKNELRREYRAMLKFATNYVEQKAKVNKLSSSHMSIGMLNETGYQRIQQLEDQLFRTSNVNGQLTIALGKVLRSANQKKPIKLSLNSAISSQTLDYLFQGLKDNREVFEISLSKCQLDNQDLNKICQLLQTDQRIQNLRIGSNRFTQLQPLIDLLSQKSRQILVLDISNAQIDLSNLDQFTQVFSQMINLQELSISGIITSSLSQNEGKIQQLMKSITQLRNLKALDISKNKFLTDALNLTLSSIKQLSNLESLSLSSIGVGDDSSKQLISMIASTEKLRKLNLSGNSKLSSINIEYALQQLKRDARIEDLDLSKCQINTQTCIQALADIIYSNKNIRSLYLQKVKLTDSLAYCLIKAISESLNIENLKLDFNDLGPVFLEKLSNMMIINKVDPQNLNKNYSTGQISNNSFQDQDSNTSMIGGNDTSSYNSVGKSKALNQGLITLSLEGNNIGDRGTIALAKLIKTPNEHTKRIRSINLNECGISSIGFEQLKQALHERGNLAQSYPSLTHVKVSIEKNNISQ